MIEKQETGETDISKIKKANVLDKTVRNNNSLANFKATDNRQQNSLAV